MKRFSSQIQTEKISIALARLETPMQFLSGTGASRGKKKP